MGYSRGDLWKALAGILGAEVFSAMKAEGSTRPEMCREAALKAFVEGLEGDSVQIIRAAILDLNTHAEFRFSD